MADYYTRDGKPAADYTEAFPTGNFDKDHRVAHTKASGYEVSTVFLGLNHSFRGGTPIIFETMVFTDDEAWQEVDMDRYPTEADALAGHKIMVDKWCAGGAA